MTGWLEQKQKKGQEDAFCVPGMKLKACSLCAFGLEGERAATGSRLWRAPYCCLKKLLDERSVRGSRMCEERRQW